MQMFTREVAEKIIEDRAREFDIGDDGIRPRKVSVENAEFDALINWTPPCDLDGADAPDPMIAPALPFPFTANQLAAFMLHGCGYFVREQYGDWADGPDPQAISKLGTQATKAKQALKKAFDAYRVAEGVVGTYDTTYSEKIQELEMQCGPWLDARDARQRIKRAHLDADVYEADRLKKMVNQLLAGTVSTPNRATLEQVPPEVTAVAASALGDVALAKPGPVSEKSWLVIDPNDPKAIQPWYTPARYFARQLVMKDSTLLQKRSVLADKVSKSLAHAGIKKRGGKLALNSDTVLKAFSNVVLG